MRIIILVINTIGKDTIQIRMLFCIRIFVFSLHLTSIKIKLQVVGADPSEIETKTIQAESSQKICPESAKLLMPESKESYQSYQPYLQTEPIARINPTNYQYNSIWED